MQQIDEAAIRIQAKLDHITHLSTGLAVLRDRALLVVRRSPDDFLGGFYEIPGGGVEDGETIEQAAQRELGEEAGLMVAKILGIFTGFDYTTDTKPRVRQINLLVEAKPGEIKLSSEHDEYQWVNSNDLSTLKMTGNLTKCIKNLFDQVDKVD